MSLFLLQVEKHTTHTPDSLFTECHELAGLAQEHEVEVFDGWDVERTQMNEGFIEL